MTNKKERVTTVRPQKDDIHKLLQPVAEGVDGDLEVEDRKHEEKALAGGNGEKVGGIGFEIPTSENKGGRVLR